MEKTYLVFGLVLVGYDIPNNFHAIRHFDSESKAEEWVRKEIEQYGGVRSFQDGKVRYIFHNVVILPHYEKVR